MSHFSVLVIGDNVAEQLAPYQENNMGDCPAQYMQFIDEETEELNKYETGARGMILLESGELLEPWDDRFKNPNYKLFDDQRTKYVHPEGSKEVLVAFKSMYETFEIYMELYCGVKKRDEKMNRYGRWDNPNSKWDWYVMGGRWGGFFTPKKGRIGLLGEPSTFDKIGKDLRDKTKADQILKRDVDFEAMIEEKKSEASARYDLTASIFNRHIKEGFRIGWKNWSEFYESYAEQKTETKNSIDFYREIYHAQPMQAAYKWLVSNREKLDLTKKESEHLTWLELDPYNCTREKYIQRAADSALSTHAIVIDGKWYERGQMGWWGAVHDEKDKNQWNAEFKKLLDSVPEETLLTVIDCHI